MTPLFADTHYFLAIINPDDAYHHDAATFAGANDAPLVTTAWVLTEVADALAATTHRRLAWLLYQDLRQDESNIIVPATQRLFERGLRFYEARPDKSWSLTDCISFLVMRDHGIQEVLTGDRHFAQAGFTPLLA
jgi:uncharacterized protein